MSIFPIIETRQVRAYSPMTQKTELFSKNICIGKDGKEITWNIDGYYYLNKNNTISKRRYKQ